MTIRSFTSSLCFERHGVHLVHTTGAVAENGIEEPSQPNFAAGIHLVTRAIPAAGAVGTRPLVFARPEKTQEAKSSGNDTASSVN
jgi:hypothetical protein